MSWDCCSSGRRKNTLLGGTLVGKQKIGGGRGGIDMSGGRIGYI